MQGEFPPHPSQLQLHTCHIQKELIVCKAVSHGSASLDPKEIHRSVSYPGIREQQGAVAILGAAQELEAAPGAPMHRPRLVICGHGRTFEGIGPVSEPVALNRGTLGVALPRVGEGAGHPHTQALRHRHRPLHRQLVSFIRILCLFGAQALSPLTAPQHPEEQRQEHVCPGDTGPCPESGSSPGDALTEAGRDRRGSPGAGRRKWGLGD